MSDDSTDHSRQTERPTLDRIREVEKALAEKRDREKFAKACKTRSISPPPSSLNAPKTAPATRDWAKIGQFLGGLAALVAAVAALGFRFGGSTDNEKISELEGRTESLRSRVADQDREITKLKNCLRDRDDWFSGVMKALGVKVDFRDGEIAPVEIHPAPLGAKEAPPIQPAKSFPVCK